MIFQNLCIHVSVIGPFKHSFYIHVHSWNSWPVSKECKWRLRLYITGIVRGIDPVKKVFHVVTSLPLDRLAKVNVIVKSGVVLPETIFTQQVCTLSFLGKSIRFNTILKHNCWEETFKEECGFLFYLCFLKAPNFRLIFNICILGCPKSTNMWT